MTDLSAAKIYSVSELTAKVKDHLETEFSELMVEGEISNFVSAASGHSYWVLKDKSAQLRCVCFRHKARAFRFRVEDGLQVVASGSLSVYEPRGEYQLQVNWLEPKGHGSLQLAFEQLKTKLQAEGLFDSARKKPIPLMPRCIGIVTSPSGAAIHDILRILRRRHDNVHVLIYPAKVQGEGASVEIASGIRYLNTLPEVEVLIIGRGGGSIEDLWAFNEEIVARAILGSRVPVISAVGHEVDYTIADFVADLRAPTPSAAAEIVISRKIELAEQVANQERRLRQSVDYHLSRLQNKILALSAERVFNSAENKLAYFRQRLDEFSFRMEHAHKEHLQLWRNQLERCVTSFSRIDLSQFLDEKKQSVGHQVERIQEKVSISLRMLKGRIDALQETLQALSPLAVLDRGYAICRDSQGRILKDVSELRVGHHFVVRLAKGEVEGVAEKIVFPK
ncbi:MAG: exodeoxyribonuclease VII large subunit [Terriglobia bacterium]